MGAERSANLYIFVLLYLAKDHGLFCSKSHEGKLFLFNAVPGTSQPTPVNYYIMVLSADVYDGKVTYFWYDLPGGQGQPRTTARVSYTKALASGSFLRFQYHASNWQVNTTVLIEGAIGVESTVYVTVVMSNTHNNYLTSAALLVVPVDLWGTEYVMMTPDTPFFVLTTMVDNKVRIKFSMSNVYTVSYKNFRTSDNKRIVPGDEMVKDLKEYTSLRIIVYQQTFSFTGTLVTAQHPVGVVCGGFEPIFRHSYRSTVDMVHDHILPIQYGGGKSFLISVAPNVCRDRLPDYLQAVALETGHTDVSEVDKIQNGSAHFSKTIRIFQQYGRLYWATPTTGTINCSDVDKYYKGMLIRIQSNKNIQMGQYRTGIDARLKFRRDYDSSSVMLIPVTMYRSYYIITVPPYNEQKKFEHNFVTILGEYTIQIVAQPDIFSTFSKKVVTQYETDTSIFVKQSPIGKEDRVLIRGQYCFNKFGVFVSGNQNGVGYMYTGGFNVYEVDTSSCKETTPIPGDQVDNDCDGQADEEAIDGKNDHDGDGKIDEDNCQGFNMQGAWSTWLSSLEDEDPCNKMDCLRERTRSCTNPRPGPTGRKCAGQPHTSVEIDYEEIPGCKDANCTPASGVNVNGTKDRGRIPCYETCRGVCDKRTNECIEAVPETIPLWVKVIIPIFILCVACIVYSICKANRRFKPPPKEPTAEDGPAGLVVVSDEDRFEYGSSVDMPSHSGGCTIIVEEEIIVETASVTSTSGL